MDRHGKLFVISGPAGAGKSEIVKRVRAKHPEIGLSVSCTTRAPRPGEVDGVDYHFVSDETFDRLIEEGAFYEWAHVHQNRYGTLKSAVAEQLARGEDLILEIDVQGCVQVMEHNPDAISVFVSPPSRENLEKRLRDRGTETEEAIRVRLGNVSREVATAYRYDYVIIHYDWNDVPGALDLAGDDLYAIIRAASLRRSDRTEFLDTLTRELRAAAEGTDAAATQEHKGGMQP